MTASMRTPYGARMARSPKQEKSEDGEIGDRYNRGESIRELAASTGISYSAARARLIAAGVSLRPMGRTLGKPQRG